MSPSDPKIISYISSVFWGDQTELVLIMRESLTSISNRRDSSWNFFRFERNSKPSRESMLTENIYIYIRSFRCIRPCEPRGARSLYVLYRLCVSRARDERSTCATIHDSFVATMNCALAN